MMKIFSFLFIAFLLGACQQATPKNEWAEIITDERVVTDSIFEENEIPLQESQIVDSELNNIEYGRPKRVIDCLSQYDSHIARFPHHAMVSLKEFIPGIYIDLRYAHYGNVFKEVLYTQGEAYLNIKAAEALKRVQEDVSQDGYELVIWDAYRPYSVTVKMWDLVRDARYAATPEKGSRHNRGMAVDITLKYKDGDYVEMPTDFDDFSKKASPLHQNISAKAKANRDYLISKMHKHGFKVLNSEWWHFDYQNWYNIPIMDIPLEKMKEL
jgi:D-alanyl-D-alanine dipeptidase